MLTKKELMKIALTECIDMIGENLVTKHKELCCCTCGMKDNGLFYYSLGMDTKETSFVLGGETPMEFYAFVVVNPADGKVIRDYKNSILPNE